MLIMDLVRTRIEWCGDVRYRESKEEIRSVKGKKLEEDQNKYDVTPNRSTLNVPVSLLQTHCLD